MLMFTLAISCLTTSNLPWFMDLTFQVPMQYCSLWHRTLLLYSVTSTTGHCFCFGSNSSFFLKLFLHWSPIIGHLPTWGVHLFTFSHCSCGSQGKNTEVVCHSLLQWTTFCQTSPPWPTHPEWPHMAWLSFIELDKAVVLDYFSVIMVSVCLPSCNTYRLTLVSLTLDVGLLLWTRVPGSKHLQLSWLQSLCAVFLKPKKIVCHSFHPPPPRHLFAMKWWDLMPWF